MPDPRCLVTFAVPEESRAFRHADVRVRHTGMGGEAAGSALRKALAEERPAWVLSSGFAGGLDPGLQVGDLLADEAVSAPLVLAGVPTTFRRGRLHTADQAAESPAEKARLHRETGAAAVDLETQAIADACAEAGVPLLVLRIISDSADEPLPLPTRIAWNFTIQRPRPFAIARHLLRHPSSIVPLARFVARLPMLQRRLAHALIDTLAAPLSQSAIRNPQSAI